MADSDQFVLDVGRVLDAVRGEFNGGPPEWGPLEAAIPSEWWGGFMWMGATTVDDYRGNRVVIQLYKHGITRRYLNLDDQGRYWKYRPDNSYVVIRTADALEHCLGDLDRGIFGDADRTTTYDANYIAGRNAALRKLGFTVVM